MLKLNDISLAIDGNVILMKFLNAASWTGVIAAKTAE